MGGIFLGAIFPQHNFSGGIFPRTIIKFQKIVSYRIMSKITVNRKGLTRTELCHRCVFQNFIATDKNIFNVSNTVSPQLILLL